MAILCPSILASDYMNMERDFKHCAEVGVKWLHVDVMDGHFVPNLTFGYEKTPLLTAKNCIITPHMSWAAVEARGRIVQITAANIRSFLDGKPQNVVNP